MTYTTSMYFDVFGVSRVKLCGDYIISFRWGAHNRHSESADIRYSRKREYMLSNIVINKIDTIPSDYASDIHSCIRSWYHMSMKTSDARVERTSQAHTVHLIHYTHTRFSRNRFSLILVQITSLSERELAVTLYCHYRMADRSEHESIFTFEYALWETSSSVIRSANRSTIMSI